MSKLFFMLTLVFVVSCCSSKKDNFKHQQKQRQEMFVVGSKSFDETSQGL